MTHIWSQKEIGYGKEEVSEVLGKTVEINKQGDNCSYLDKEGRMKREFKSDQPVYVLLTVKQNQSEVIVELG